MAASKRRRIFPALDWLSLGFGVTSFFAPDDLARLIGIDGRGPAMLRVVGLREPVNGLGILTQANPTPWLWARVAAMRSTWRCCGRRWTLRTPIATGSRR